MHKKKNTEKISAEKVGRKKLFVERRYFLLRVDEYVKYREHIPLIFENWLLCLPGGTSGVAAFVGSFGDLCNGDRFVLDRMGVRPALRIGSLFSWLFEPGDEFARFGNNWVYLGCNIAISKDIVATEEFDYFLIIYTSEKERGFCK